MIEELLDQLGDAFRGLWTGITVQDSFGGITKKKDWTVTFLLDGDYVETPGKDSPEEAIEFAINLVKRGSTK